jgi:glutathione synthase/RimK-type ligase-like ATP-grasp enzyme
MTHSSVLVISSPLDLHARAVTWALRQYGCDVSYYDTGAVGTEADWWSFDISDEISPIKTPSGAPRFDSVWDRRRFPKIADVRVHASDREFVAGESRYFDLAMLKLLDAQHDLRWIDPPRAIDRAENKLEQLVAARQCGLSVPRTLVSRNYARVRAFVEPMGSFVVKPFRGHLWYQDDTPRFEAIANRVEDPSVLTEAAVSVCPAIYQESVNKVADIRVVVIGSNVYATRYSVKAGLKAEFDCRVNMRSEELTVAAPVEIDERTKTSLLALMKHFGITYASADFAESENGELVFLDLNPQGQFLFNEHFAPSHRLLDAMARHLIGGAAQLPPDMLITIDDYVATEDHARFTEEFEFERGNPGQPRGSYSQEITSPIAAA